MRLLEDDGHGNLRLVEKHDNDIPRYAILSHTWGRDNEEFNFKDVTEGLGRNKIGYQKIEFCRAQAASDELQYFWVDTCCIDKSSSAELNTAINSMFRWYHNADRCYVYLSDVSTSGDPAHRQLSTTSWEIAFRESRWFRRGWTLQELIAPASVEFFSREGDWLGSKKTLEQDVHDITGVTIEALRGESLSHFTVEERMSWAKHRKTKQPEDEAYALLGIFDVFMTFIYAEGREKAFARLRDEIDKSAKRNPPIKFEIAEEAAFDAIGRDHDPYCLPRTRTELLQNIKGWLSNNSATHLYWLSGWAGTGKSTIARTIAREYTNPQWQLGSFFFSKGGGDAGHIHKFVGTLAMQLSYRWPAYKSALQHVIAADEGIARRTQKAQWAALIQKPLSALLTSPSSQRVLLVVDAVDECGTEDDMSHLIELLLDARGIDRTAFRILVTSRPEVAIRDGFDYDLDQRHLNLVLHQISDFIVQNDLFIFFHHHFTHIQRSRRLGTDWPGQANINRLVAMSGNLFIWAATVCRYVSRGGRLVKNRLLSVLESRHAPGETNSALDQIYLTVLENAISNDLSDKEKVDVTNQLRLTLGTIAVLFAPLSVAGLGHLLGHETEEVEQTLADLHSILDIPSGTERPIRLHHPSFRDFLYDRSRCNESLFIDQTVTHSIVAERSLSVMSRLRKDLCGVKSPGTLVEDVSSAVVTQHLSSALQYMCRYWLDHVEHAQMRLDDDGPVHRFLQKYCLYWMEAMSLTGKVAEAITMMMKLESLIDEKNAPALQSLVRDIVRFIHTFSHVLSIAPLQLYSAGLIFSPTQSILRQSFSVEAPKDIWVMSQVPDEWNACIQALEGHSGSVISVVFSPDGSRLASGSYDNTVRVWDVQTGRCQHTLNGHSSLVASVVFSPDGSRVASGSGDNTVRVWDVQTGRCQHTLNGHSSSVISVVFSADGSRLASGSYDKTVRVWDVQTGRCQHTLDGHSNRVASVVFSADGSRVASGSGDNTVRVWDVQTGRCQHTLNGHSSLVASVVFSPDGSRVASGSGDNTVRVWDVQTGRCQHTLNGHSSSVISVVFSADGSRLASGSGDKTVRVWDVQTGRCQHTLDGHSSSVASVVFSADGSRVASGSDDNTVRVWDVQTGRCQHTLNGHSRWVASVVFSADGSRVASGSYDNTVRVWDVQTGRCQHTLNGHSRWVASVVFSPDGSRVASGSWDNTVRVWDVQTGRCQHTLDGHSSWVASVVFSPDGSRVASGSGDNTVRVWDVQTGRCQHTLEGHSNRVASVVFSPDGSRLASGSGDNTVRVWDVQTGRCQHTLDGHSDTVASVVFSADGSRVASGSYDNTVRVWDVTNAEELLRYDSGAQDQIINFSGGSTKIVVNGASLSLPSQILFAGTQAGSAPSHSTRFISKLGINNDWITLSSERILWLPPEYRPGSWASYGDMIVVGSANGRVTFVRCISTSSSSA